MKKALLWIAVRVIGTLLLVVGLGYVFGPRPKELIRIESTEKMDRLGQINETLASHDLTLCEVYKWIGTMEAETRKELEIAEPDISARDRAQTLNQNRDFKWYKYRTKHQLPDSLRSLVNEYGLEECNQK